MDQKILAIILALILGLGFIVPLISGFRAMRRANQISAPTAVLASVVFTIVFAGMILGILIRILN